MQSQNALSPTADLHYSTTINAIYEGRIVPFLGAGANLCDRPDGIAWKRGEYLPSGVELASYLAERFGYLPSTDLARVSQYVALIGGGPAPLYDALRHLFGINYPPTLLHKFLAVLPALARDRGHAPPYQLIVTTNYDDVLERTFHLAGEPIDVVSYMAEGEDRGKFRHWSYVFKPKSEPTLRPRREQEDEVEYQIYVTHYQKELAEYQRQQLPGQLEKDEMEFRDARVWPPRVDSQLISKPNEYASLSLDQRPVILKIHGAVDRITPQEDGEDRLDSFVITEDDYIDYLTRTDLSALVPKKLEAKLRRSNFLFLGYSLRDWNLRVILRRIWGEQKLKFNSWAIQLDPEDLDQIFWMRRDVQIINKPLNEYIRELIDRLHANSYISALDEKIESLKS